MIRRRWLAYLLSLMLYSGQFSYVYAQAANADSLPDNLKEARELESQTETVEVEPSSEESAISAEDQSVVADTDGQDLQAVNDSEHWRENAAVGYGNRVLNAVTLFLVGWIGSSMTKCDQKSPAGQIYIVSAVAYLAGEALTAFKFKREVRREIIVHENTKALSEDQQKTLKKMYKTYKKKEKAIKTRQAFLTGAGAGMLAAGVVSMAEAAKRERQRGDVDAAAKGCQGGAEAMATANPGSAPACARNAQVATEANQIVQENEFDETDGKVAEGGTDAEATGSISPEDLEKLKTSGKQLQELYKRNEKLIKKVAQGTAMGALKGFGTGLPMGTSIGGIAGGVSSYLKGSKGTEEAASEELTETQESEERGEPVPEGELKKLENQQASCLPCEQFKKESLKYIDDSQKMAMGKCPLEKENDGINIPGLDGGLPGLDIPGLDIPGLDPGAIFNVQVKQKLNERLLEEPAMMAIFDLPFLRNKDVSQWRQQILGQNIYLPTMQNNNLGFKTKTDKKWQGWALASLDLNSSAVDAQLVYKEWFGLNHGAKSSPSIDEYEQLKKMQNANSARLKNEFFLAVKFGLDLFMPEAIAQEEQTETAVDDQAQNEALAAQVESGERRELTAKEKEELEAEKHVSAEINNIGKYGPTKMMQYLGLGAGAAGLAVGMIGKTSGMMDSLIAKPLNRGLLMTATSVMAFVTAGTVKKDLKKVKENRKYVRNLLRRFEGKTEEEFLAEEQAAEAAALASTQRELQGTSGLSLNQGIIRQDQKAGQEFLRDELGLPCPGGYDKDGECQEAELELEVKKVSATSGLGNFTAGFLQPLDTLASGQKNASNGKLERARALLGEFGSNKNVAGIKKTLTKLQDDINDSRNRLGKAPLNFDAGVDKITQGLTGVIGSGASRIPGGLDGLAALTRGVRSIDPANPDRGRKSVAKKVARRFLPRKNFRRRRSASSGGGGQVAFGAFRSGGGDSSSAKELGRYKTKFNDVNKNDVSLFKIISVRYLKSGLPRLLRKRRR